jgi:hypothetical protein
MANIKLNFLAVTPLTFEFEVFRKLKTEEDEKEEGIYVYHLPKDAHANERTPFLVTFEPRPDFEKFTASSSETIGLTKKYLTRQLLKTLSDKPSPFPFRQAKTFTDDKIEFVIGTEIKGEKIIYLNPYYFEEQARYGFLIDYEFSLAEGQKFDKEVQRLSLSLDKNYKSNRNYYSEKYHLIQAFLTKIYPVIQYIPLDDGQLQIANKLTEVQGLLLNTKEYIFKNNYTSKSQFQGIKNYGPYSGVQNEVLFVFIFEERFRSFANDIYLSLVGKSNPGTFPGFQQMFQVPFGLNNVKHIKLTDGSKGQLDYAVEQIKGIKNENGNKKIIGMYLEDHAVGDDVSSSNYYYLKYHFIEENIPLQVVNFRNLGGTNALKWSTSNLALAMFSKLGGIPWIVKPSNNNCLILGVGSSHKREPATGRITKYFAYTVCLDSSGLYKELAILANEESKEDYITNLKNSVVALLKSDKFNQYKTCVLHLPFKIKQNEIQALSAAINEVSDMEFVTIKVNLGNKYFGYSDHNTLVPYESSFIKLSRTEYLVWFEGLQYGKEVVDKRLANPVHIQFLHLKSQPRVDERKFLQDVLNLSGANWRGFNAKSIPISIYYSQLITDYSKAFEGIHEDNKFSLSNEKPWFL